MGSRYPTPVPCTWAKQTSGAPALMDANKYKIGRFNELPVNFFKFA